MTSTQTEKAASANGAAAEGGGLSLPLELPPATRELQERARKFVDEHVIPLEQEAERLYGRLPQEKIDAVKQAGIDAGLNGGQHSPEYGGQGWSLLDWVVVEEQYGRSTNGIYWHVPNAYNVFHNASDEQADKYLRPLIAGKMKDAYAVTEAEAGSDPSGIATTAERTDAGFRINGEKWFVTSGDIADVLIVMANVMDGDERLPTLFLVDIDTPGVEIVDDPQFTHHYPEGHPTIRFTDVEVGEDAVVQGVGEGEAMQRAWFLEERLGIAARGCGAMWRLLEESVEWATNRVQGGNRIWDYQGVSFPLADSAADAAAGRLLTYQVAVLADGGTDLKVVHGKASMAKLFVSEAACRCADRAVQALGGRGYMRSYTAERLLRELRVDRIWEGTSEIQRLVVARGLERRGVERMLH
jgi:acyl-CoA dehydrogenase